MKTFIFTTTPAEDFSNYKEVLITPFQFRKGDKIISATGKPYLVVEVIYVLRDGDMFHNSQVLLVGEA